MTRDTMIRKLIAHLKADGFLFRAVFDGEEVQKPANVGEALKLINNLDECALYFRKQGFSTHTVSLVLDYDQDLGDVISDWSFGTKDLDGFNVAMDKFLEIFD